MSDTTDGMRHQALIEQTRFIRRALLIGVCVTIYYSRQIARAAVNVSPRAPVTADPTQRAEGTRINQLRKV